MQITELIFIVAVCPVLFQGSGLVCILLHTIKRSIATISSTKYADIFLPVCSENIFSSYYANIKCKFLHYLHPSCFYILFNLVSLLLLYVKIINIHDIPVIKPSKKLHVIPEGKRDA